MIVVIIIKIISFENRDMLIDSQLISIINKDYINYSLRTAQPVWILQIKIVNLLPIAQR